MAEHEKTFQVCLRGIAPWVSAVSYEKDAEDLKLFFTLKRGTLSPSDIVLREDGAGHKAIGADSKEKERAASPLALLPLQHEEVAGLGGASRVPLLCQQLAERLPAAQGAFVLFASGPGAFQGVLWQGTRKLRARAKDAFSCQEKGGWLLCDIAAPSLKEASGAVWRLSEV